MKKSVFVKRALFALALVIVSTIQLNGQVKVNESGDLHVGYDSNSSRLLFGEPYVFAVSYPSMTPQYTPARWIMYVDSNGDFHLKKGGVYMGAAPYSTDISLVSSATPPYSSLGIGRTPSSGIRLDVNGSIGIYGVVQLTSDERLKSDIASLKGKASDIYQLEGASYRKSLPGIKNEQTESVIEYGFLAQELEKYFPDLVKKDDDGYLMINYIGLIPLIVETLKEQKKELDALKAGKSTLLETELRSTTGNTSIEADLPAELYQNIPNPFSETTRIGYYLPSTIQTAFLCVYDLQGKQIKRYALNERGENNLIIEGFELSPGMYLYALIADGQEVDVKRMILTE